MHWIYNGLSLLGDEKIEEELSSYAGFVYSIVHRGSGKQYFGKKRLFFIRHKKEKNRRNRRKITSESDWRDYWGSSMDLLCDIEKYGKEAFDREILRFCKTLSECSYYELKYQMENDVLLHPDKYYNAYVGGRISRRQMGIK